VRFGSEGTWSEGFTCRSAKAEGAEILGEYKIAGESKRQIAESESFEEAKSRPFDV